MVMVRSLRKGRYFIAFFLTLAIFIIGILLGYLISNYRASTIEEVSRMQRMDYDSLQLQYLYINTFVQEKNCGAAMKALDKNLNDLELTRMKLEAYLSTPIAGTKEFDVLKREYLQSEVRYWLFLKQTEEVCKNEQDSVSVLYFYSNQQCPDCVTQGMVLTYLKDKFKERLLIFSLDSDFTPEPLIGILKDSYNITSVPSLIIKDKKYESLRAKEELLLVICGYYKEAPDACKIV